MRQIKHRACGGVAFWYEGDIIYGNMIEPDRAIIDWETRERPIAFFPMQCQVCHQVIHSVGQDLEWDFDSDRL